MCIIVVGNKADLVDKRQVRSLGSTMSRTWRRRNRITERGSADYTGVSMLCAISRRVGACVLVRVSSQSFIAAGGTQQRHCLKHVWRWGLSTTTQVSHENTQVHSRELGVTILEVRLRVLGVAETVDVVAIVCDCGGWMS